MHAFFLKVPARICEKYKLHVLKIALVFNNFTPIIYKSSTEIRTTQVSQQSNLFSLVFVHTMNNSFYGTYGVASLFQRWNPL